MLEALRFETEFRKRSVEGTDFLIRFGAHPNGSHDRCDAYDWLIGFNQISSVLSCDELDFILIPFSFSFKEFHTVDRCYLLSYFLVFCFLLWLGCLDQECCQPKVQRGIFHDLNEVNAFEDLSFLKSRIDIDISSKN